MPENIVAAKRTKQSKRDRGHIQMHKRNHHKLPPNKNDCAGIFFMSIIALPLMTISSKLIHSSSLLDAADPTALLTLLANSLTPSLAFLTTSPAPSPAALANCASFTCADSTTALSLE
jgi:hypothetical protein